MTPNAASGPAGTISYPGPIFLIGFMGSGKTTLGRALADRHPALRYVDLDDEVERLAGMTIREIFARDGERRFRELENGALRRFALQSGVIIGCGGGTPCQPGNMELMNSRGLTVLLRATDEALLRRLLEAQAQRPLLNGMTPAELLEYIRSEQLRREPYYSLARLEFPSDLLETEEEVAATCEAFRRLIADYQLTE